MTTPGQTPQGDSQPLDEQPKPPTADRPGADRGTPPEATGETRNEKPVDEVLEDPMLAADPIAAAAPENGAGAGDIPADDAAAPSADGVRVAELEAALSDRTEDLQRITAEYANFRRRTERDRQTLIGQAKSGVVAEFLPILDDLDLAKQHGDLGPGLKALSGKLAGIFEKLGVTRFGEEGDPFDPEIHEAVQDISSGDEKALGTVLRPGYFIGEKLVRTAMAIIADKPQHPETGDAAAEPAPGEAES